jgi:hypothetical protein
MLDPLLKYRRRMEEMKRIAERNSYKNGYYYPQPSAQKDGTWVTCPRCGAKVWVPLGGWGQCACGKSVW